MGNMEATMRKMDRKEAGLKLDLSKLESENV
jgi:hypothetical protein